MHDTLAAWLAWAATIVGAGLLARGVLGRLDPRRRSRRCPRCRYDMSASSGVRCPECGHEARHERALHRGRRSWRLGLLGMTAVLGSHTLHSVPDIEERGWSGAVPTTALIASLPWLRPDLEQIAVLHGRSLQAPGDVESMNERLYLELLDARVARDRLWGWQQSLLGAVCRRIGEEADDLIWQSAADELMGSTRWADDQALTWTSLEPASSAVTARTRECWPVGVPIYARIDGQANSFRYRIVGLPRTPGLREFRCVRMRGMQVTRVALVPWTDGLENLGTPAPGARELRYAVHVEDAEFAHPLLVHRWRRIDHQDLVIDAKLTGVTSDYVDPVVNEEVAATVRDAIAPVVVGMPAVLDLGATDHGLGRALAGLGSTTFAIRTDIVEGDAVVATGEAWFETRSRSGPPWIAPYGTTIDLEVLDEAALRAADRGTLTLRVRGDAAVALRNFDALTYWQGEFTVPVRVETGAWAWTAPEG